MNQFLNQLFSSLFQVTLFGCLPFFWWCLRKKKQPISFPEFVGLTKIQTTAKTTLFFYSFLSLMILTAIGFLSLQAVADPQILANSQFIHGTLWRIPALFLYAFVQTAFAEELLFRGFLAKRFIARFGYRIGNGLQALLFSLTHILLLIVQSNSRFLLLFVALLTFFIGYFMGFLNEKKAGGSIFPSWLIHGCSNLLSTLILIYLKH